jgi:hypothetical protein
MVYPFDPHYYLKGDIRAWCSRPTVHFCTLLESTERVEPERGSVVNREVDKNGRTDYDRESSTEIPAKNNKSGINSTCSRQWRIIRASAHA